MKAIYAHYVCDDSFMTLELVSLTVEIMDYKMDIVKVAWCLKALSSKVYPLQTNFGSYTNANCFDHLN